MNRTAFFLGLSGAVVVLGAGAAVAGAGGAAAALVGGAAMNGAFSLAKDLLKDRFKDWVKSPPEDPGKLFANGHLTELIGQAIQVVLTRERNESVGQFKEQLKELLKPVVGYWQANYPRLTDGTLEAAHAVNLTEVLHRQIQDTEDFPLATPEAWDDFLRDYAREQKVALEDEPRRRAAGRLHRELGHALYEKAKQAAETNPRAAAAIQLQFQSWMLQGIAELHESVRAGFADQARKLAYLHAELVLVSLEVGEIRDLAKETATLLQRFDGVLGKLFALALDNEERGQRMEDQLRLIREHHGDGPLPPLVDRLSAKETPGEFVQLIDALLVREGRRSGWKYRPYGGIDLNTSGIGTEVTIGKPFGFNPPVWINVESLTDGGILGPIFSDDLRRLRRFKARNEVANCVVISPAAFDGAEWDEAVADAEAVGTKMHNFTQPEFEPWLRRCPPLLARYYPEVAARRPDAQGFDGRPFSDWLRGFSEKVLADHRNLHLFGFPRRPQAANDPANDPNTFLLEQVFIPQMLVPRGAKEAQARTAGQLIQGDGCHVLLGDPGAGKTSLLRYLAVACGEGREVAGVKCGPRVPLFLPLREFVQGRKERPTLLEALAWHCRKAANLQPADVHPWRLEALLLMGEALVFFDGLDESGDHHSRREIARLIQDFHGEYPASPVWVTSRIVGYDRASLDKDTFTHFEVTPFDPGQQAAFVRQWYLAKLPRPEAGAQREQEAGKFLGSLERAVPEIRELAANPLLLTLAIWVHDEIGYLPPGRGQLYDHCVEMLVHKRDSARFGEEKSPLQLLTPPVTSADLRLYYADIALKAQELNAGREREARGIIPETDLLRWLASRRERDLQRHHDTQDSYPVQAEADARAILDFSEERCGLLRFRGDGTYAFLHLSFQEHLAAERKASSLAGKPVELADFLAAQVEKEAWRETLLLLLHHLRNKQVRDETDDDREVPFSHWLVARLKAPGQPPVSPAYQRLLGMALRDGIKFSPAHCRWILERLLADWRERPVFDSETFQVLTQVAGFSPESRPELLRLLEEAWQREAGLAALQFLRLRVRLLGWPGDPAESGRVADELAGRLGGLESPPPRERGLSSPPPDHLPILKRAAELLGDAGVEPVANTAEGFRCMALVRERLQSAMWHPQIKVKQRAAAGIALARVGDPRPGVGCRPAGNDTPALPDLAWVEVGGGDFVMGSAPDEGYGGERPQMNPCKLVPHAFKLARYPVTVAQFAAFVAADGYGKADGPKPEWWADAGWQWRVAEKIEGPEDYDAVFQTPNHPRVGVSWFETHAFACWLNPHREALGLPAEWHIRLPTEAEWERAVRGTEGRTYPWGEDEPEGRCNHAGQIGHTSAVGLFPAGDTADHPAGIADLAGNVWEWCAAAWLNHDPEGVVRGGSWFYQARYCRAAFSGGGHPGVRDIDLGFRLAAGPKLQPAEPSGPERRSRG